MDLKGRKIAVLAEKEYEDLELWYPLLRFREAGAQVDVIAPEAEKTYPSKHGYEVKSDVSARDVSPERYEMIIVPGGWAPDYLRRNPDVVNMLRESYEHGAVVGAICHGGSLLCSTGILKGRQMTSFHSIKHDIMNAGAVWTDAEVVVDERLVSSRTPADLPAFVKGLADALEHQGSGR